MTDSSTSTSNRVPPLNLTYDELVLTLALAQQGDPDDKQEGGSGGEVYMNILKKLHKAKWKAESGL